MATKYVNNKGCPYIIGTHMKQQNEINRKTRGRKQRKHVQLSPREKKYQNKKRREKTKNIARRKNVFIVHDDVPNDDVDSNDVDDDEMDDDYDDDDNVDDDDDNNNVHDRINREVTTDVVNTKTN
ncbi:unnamed protein product [Rotaria magnacalcarata]|uniref:Uncharacterized protein n=1 Tax=Rotaria magnacalcarata TaxID=392030 RepID=A0A816N917_9BILA|nr:unnamed protein product [Rotaria magnacalcarata]CAF4275244.1 unnamed protein product [Rotaria magnacalcarata]